MESLIAVLLFENRGYPQSASRSNVSRTNHVDHAAHEGTRSIAQPSSWLHGRHVFTGSFRTTASNLQNPESTRRQEFAAKFLSQPVRMIPNLFVFFAVSAFSVP
jgi:hypothetical protein